MAVMYSDKLAEWARSSEAAGKIAAAGALAKSMGALVAQVQDFDRERMAINVLNGTLRMERARRKRPAEDVAAGKSEWHTPWVMKLHPHRREDFITKLADVEYRESARSPTYEAFLAVVQPKPEMRRFLAQWGGLSMTGFTGEQKLAFFYGGGSRAIMRAP